jgi:predicted NUDIX family phosphoesterase
MNDILVIPRNTLHALPESGAWPFDTWPRQHRWLPRPQAEEDENQLQIIPYAVVENADGLIWCYRRTGGDARLAERRSCGVGGHVDRADWAGDIAVTVIAALRREVAEELNWRLPTDQSLQPSCWIYEGLTGVGRVHLGVVFELNWEHTEAPQPAAGEKLESLGFLPRSAIANDDSFELWSRLAIAGIEAKR